MPVIKLQVQGRFHGWCRRRVAAVASIECETGIDTCYKVLFQGKPADLSIATKRVAAWARRQGLDLVASGPQGGKAAEERGLADILEDAERNILGG